MSAKADDLASVRLADGQLSSVELAPDSLTVRCKDWQDAELVFSCGDTIAYEYAATDSSSLSHWTESERNPYIGVALQRAGDRRDGWRCFELWSIDERTPVLRIVAQSVSFVRRPYLTTGDSST